VTWRQGMIAASVVGLLIRVVWPEARPIHHDEAVNWWLSGSIFNQGYYDYDAENYHGPLFFYVTVLGRVLGRNLLALRLPTALISASVVPMTGGLRSVLGDRGSLFAAWALALSPPLVYFGRDAIHESTLVAASLAAFVAAVRWRERPGERRTWALWLGAALGAMVATKETFLIVGGSWGLALGAAWLVGGLRDVRPDRTWAKVPVGALLVIVPLFAGFGLHVEGLVELFESLFLWSSRGVEGGGHDKAWLVWPQWIGVTETAGLGLAAAGVLDSVRRRHAVGIGLTVWLLATVAVYSAVAYKTPWCILQACLPLGLLAGLGGAALARTRVGLALAVALLSLSFVRAVDLAFVHPEDPAGPLVYVQTRAALAEVMEDADAALSSADDTTLRGWDTARYPMNWYLDRPGYDPEEEDPWPDDVDADVVLTSPKAGRQFIRRMEGTYLRRQIPFRSEIPMQVWIHERHEPLLRRPSDWDRVLPEPRPR